MSLAGTLADWVQQARERTLALVDDLSDSQLMAQPHPIVNPLHWEMAHVAWFQEFWVLRQGGKKPSIRQDADALFDSGTVEHYTRWELPYPSRADLKRYALEVRDRVVEVAGLAVTPQQEYFVKLSVFHEDMHAENLACSRQTLGYAAPPLACATMAAGEEAAPLSGDVEIAGGAFVLGAEPTEPFVFDNEKWAHPIVLQPFRIATAAVTQDEFLTFVDDGGYLHRDWWEEAGWEWLRRTNTSHPAYWERDTADRWLRRQFEALVPLQARLPMHHVNWYEASAYCRWAGRRLPSEAEWEAAAAGAEKFRFPWGDGAPSARFANLDWQAAGCVAVDLLPAGDSPAGCRQMLGNVWEWTASDFLPYPGFVADPYEAYSRPWFGTHKVLRGGSWASSGRMLRNTWRNFYTPDRRDIWAGFRTCAL